MKCYRVLLISLLACAVACSGCSSEPDYAALESRWSTSFAHSDKLRELRDDVTRELSQRPDDARLLRLRVAVNNALEDTVAADKDIYKLADLFPDAPFYQFEKCLTTERRDGYSAERVRCYAAILPLYEKRVSAERLERDWSYIFILLLAESPDAEALRENFLRNAGDDPSVWFDKQFLKYFNRRDYIEGKVPPEMWENAPPPRAKPEKQ